MLPLLVNVTEWTRHSRPKYIHSFYSGQPPFVHIGRRRSTLCNALHGATAARMRICMASHMAGHALYMLQVLHTIRHDVRVI